MPSKVIDGKTAVTELVQELDKTRRELAKATLALNQAETNNLQLKESLSNKDKALSQLQQELVERDASHRLEVAAVAQGSDTHQQVSHQKIHFLEAEVDRLRQENEVINDYVTQNQQLRDVLTQCHTALAELQRANAELRTKMATEIQSKTQSLEEDFTRRLVESERKLRQDAFNALSEESKVALAGNDKLQTVLQRQNETLDSVLQRCKDLEEAQQKIDEERVLIESDTSAQQREISRLHRILEQSNDRGYQLEDALKQRRIERASFELLFVEHNAVKEQLEKEKDKSRRALREAERWREKAYQLADQLGADEKRDTLMKLHAIAQHSELLERNAERNRKRKEKLQASKQKNAEVVRAIESFEQGRDNTHNNKYLDDDEDEDENEHEFLDEDLQQNEELLHQHQQQRKLQVSAMDILAIWNVNYEKEDAGYFPTSSSSMNGGVVSTTSPVPQNNNNTSARGVSKNQAQSSSSLPPINQNHNSSKKQLVVDAERTNRDLGLSVVSAPKLANSHNVRRLKEASGHQQQRAAQARNDQFAISGVKQKTPLSS